MTPCDRSKPSSSRGGSASEPTAAFSRLSREQPLVSVSIPTFNSARTLALCLDSVTQQTYPEVEINIVDGNSGDETVEIAGHYGVDVVQYAGALLGARSEGAKLAEGKYILLLDSDQVLGIDAIQRCVN